MRGDLLPPPQHFNSQPHKEADGSSFIADQHNIHFNSQPHKEADRNKATDRHHESHFNSQPHKEADHLYPYKALLCILFQLTASQGG